MLHILTICVFFYNLISKKKKINVFVNYLLMWIIFGWSYGSYDTMIYIDKYCNPSKYSASSEFLFRISIDFSRKLGLSYRTYFVIISAFIIFSLCLLVFSFSEYPGYVFDLFYLFPLGYSFCQLRFFWAFAFVILAVYEMLKRDKKSRICAFCFLAVAAFIHYACIFFFAYFIVLILDDIKKTVWMTVLGVIASSFLMPYVLNIVKSVPFLQSKLERVINGQTTAGNYKYIGMYLGLYILYFFILWLEKRNSNIADNGFSRSIIHINLVNLISIPLMVNFSTFFLRVIMYSQVFNYIYYSNVVKSSKGRFGRKQAFVFFAVLLSIVVLHKVMFWDDNVKELTIIPLFKQNQLFG